MKYHFLDGAKSPEPSKILEIQQGGSHLLSDGAWHELATRLDLSPIELRIVQSLFDDLKERTIARRLGVSMNTVHTHFKRLYYKLGVSSHVAVVMHVFAQFIRSPLTECHLNR